MPIIQREMNARIAVREHSLYPSIHMHFFDVRSVKAIKDILSFVEKYCGP